jgi:hypothetical protein
MVTNPPGSGTIKVVDLVKRYEVRAEPSHNKRWRR